MKKKQAGKGRWWVKMSSVWQLLEPVGGVFEIPGLMHSALLTHTNKHISMLSAGDMCSRSNFLISHCVPLFCTDLLLLWGQLAPLIAEHPRDFGEGHIWSLSP